MKTTIDIPDELYRQIKAKTALAGESVRNFVLDALKTKLKSPKKNHPSGWRFVFGKGNANAIKKVQNIIDEEFSVIDKEGW